MLRKTALLALITGVVIAWPPACAAQLRNTGRLQAVITALNDALHRSDAAKFASQFSHDGDLWIAGESFVAGRPAIGKALPKSAIWSESTAPQIQGESVRLISPDVALVDARLVQYGSVTVKQAAPITMVLKLAGTQWEVVTMRITPSCASGPPSGLARP